MPHPPVKKVCERAWSQIPDGQGDGVQDVQRSAEHKGTTRNAAWHGLGLEARGTKTGRQATREPKGRATPRREKQEAKSPMEKRVSFH